MTIPCKLAARCWCAISSASLRVQRDRHVTAQGQLSPFAAEVSQQHLRQGSSGLPVVELASRTRVLKLGDNAPEAPRSPPTIPTGCAGTTSASPFSISSSLPIPCQAFNEVVRLRPDYADGYTNIALTNSRGRSTTRPAPALAAPWRLIRPMPAPDTTMACSKGARGIPNRRWPIFANGRDVPESRDARRDLGHHVLPAANNPEALEQFEALQAIDSDDLTAHYNLSILYRRMGEAKSIEEQEAVRDKKQDPGALTTRSTSCAHTLSFQREHAMARPFGPASGNGRGIGWKLEFAGRDR